MTAALDLGGVLPRGGTVVEASAGTGKTYTLTALAARWLLEEDVRPDQLLVVTFTRAAAGELRERVRARLGEVLTVLDAEGAGAGRAPADWLRPLLALPADVVRRRAESALTRFDDATITTIHAFCQQTLRQVGVRTGDLLEAELADDGAAGVAEVCRDLLVARLAHDPLALTPTPARPGQAPLTMATIEDRFVDAVRTVLGNPGAAVVPGPSAGPVDGDEALGRAWAALVHDAVAEVRRRRARRRQVAFDDLIAEVHRLLHDPDHGDGVRALLRERYRTVLVDEFQDTDPVQWEIFRDAFAGRDLVVVGDPKQAIYRFRGADVAAYLDATEQAANRFGLTTNRRSDADLVAALNVLLGGCTFGHERIRYVPVAPAPGAPARALGPTGAPLQIRWLRSRPELCGARGAMVRPRADGEIVADLARVVVELLDHGRGEGGRRVEPGDVAVLVRTHAEVERVVRALRAARVPVVSGASGSVLGTPAAEQWHHLLAALARPHRAGEVRAAALGWFLGWSAADLDEAGDEGVAAVQETCAGLADVLTRHGVAGLLAELRATSHLLARVLGRPSGERDLTDLEHVAELLGAAVGPVTAPAAVLRTFEELLADTPDPFHKDHRSEATPEARQRRIDSDADAVHVGTIHAAKGLEYPVVLLPWPARAAAAATTWSFTGPDGRRHLDLASRIPWSDPALGERATCDARKAAEEAEALGDEARLLYVALTRARHRVVLWWAPYQGTWRSPLASVLFATPGERDDDTTRAALAELVGRAGGTISVEELAAPGAPAVWGGRPADEDPALATSTLPRRRRDPAWRRWSFSTITAGHDEAPLHGGLDEPVPDPAAEADPVVAPDPTAGAMAPTLPFPPAEAVVPLLGGGGGTAFGTLVHEILERVDPAEAPATLPGIVADVVHRHGDVTGAEELTRDLAAALRSPLGPLFDGRRLVDLPAHDRLAELDFHLPIAGTRGRVPVRALGEVLATHLPVHDPVRSYADALAGGRFPFVLAGELHGSIDAVVRFAEPGGDTAYVVIDYKTNRLPAPAGRAAIEAYGPAGLARAMAEHHYPLQALLYLVATHRYLRWRQPGYDPARHLRGAAYLFLRGMAGGGAPSDGGQPSGVFAWRPPAAAVLAVDALLATGAAP